MTNWLARLLCMILLLLAGSGLLVHGVIFHKLPLDEAKQRVVSVPVPTMSGGEMPLPEAPSDSTAPDKTPAEKSEPASDDVDPFNSPPSAEAPASKSENPFDTAAVEPSAPSIKYEKITEDYVDVHYEAESAIVRDVTIGGVMLLANGHLKRTYTGKPPALCPT
jgi:hypothetical protein